MQKFNFDKLRVDTLTLTYKYDTRAQKNIKMSVY